MKSPTELASLEAVQHIVVVARPETREQFDAIVEAVDGPEGFADGYASGYLSKKLDEAEKITLHLHPPKDAPDPDPQPDPFVVAWLKENVDA